MPLNHHLPTVADLARMIDHSLLHPTLTDEQLHAGLAVARRCGCATACVKPYAVPMSVEALLGSGVGVCAVTGFPHGNSHTALKVTETDRAIAEGATEIDVVVNIGKVLADDWDYVAAELTEVNAICLARGALLKVIFENDYLQDSHIVRLCEICTEVGVAFVKTSTGYGFVQQPDGAYRYRGATDEHLRLMRRHSGSHVRIKAAGGIRTLDDVLRVRVLGVNRIGATATEKILAEAIRRGLPGPVPAGLVEAATPFATANN
ncbi:MAG TPA: deoxyribose-phosphate aldolase [Opitutaceae bacterium]|nr:deoxyribose-phosphate aldolase [Opitutaceae bacterium]